MKFWTNIEKLATTDAVNLEPFEVERQELAVEARMNLFARNEARRQGARQRDAKLFRMRDLED